MSQNKLETMERLEAIASPSTAAHECIPPLAINFFFSGEIPSGELESYFMVRYRHSEHGIFGLTANIRDTET